MLWKQKKKSYQLQSIPFQNPEIEEDIKFNEEELDVPKTTRLFKVEKILKGSLDSILIFTFSENSNYGSTVRMVHGRTGHLKLFIEPNFDFFFQVSPAAASSATSKTASTDHHKPVRSFLVKFKFEPY